MSKKRPKVMPCVRDRVLHPVYGEATVILVDTAYASGRGWIACNFGNSGQFACFPDEVQVVAKESKP